MNQRFQNADIRRVSEQYAENELYKAVCTIGLQLENEMKEFGLCPEECFTETLELLSSIAEKGEDILLEIERLWLIRENEYRRHGRQASVDEIRKAVGIVFGFAILAIDSSRHPFYRYALSKRLMQAIANHKWDGWSTTLGQIFDVPLPDGWFDAYVNEEPEGGMSPASPSQKRKTKADKPKPKRSFGKPMTLKYYTHGNNGVLMKQHKRVDIVFTKWTEWGWIDGNTTSEDFDAFFEGEPRHCNITWTANTTILTILLQELLKQPYIEEQTGCKAKSLVEQQFGKTANSDRKRLDNISEERIELTLLILDIKNPLPERHGKSATDEFDIQDAALKEIFAGQLRSTKGI